MDTKLYKLKHPPGKPMRETYVIYYRVAVDMPWQPFELEHAGNMNEAIMQFDNLVAIDSSVFGIGTPAVIQNEKGTSNES
jgi:hypothetical protein